MMVGVKRLGGSGVTDRRVIGDYNLRDLGDPLAEIGVFAGADDPAEVDRRLRAVVSREVEAMLHLTEKFDAFDVIELMRLRELPISPELSLEPEFDGSGAAIEVVALAMLGRGERHPSGTPREDTRPSEVIDELHTRAKRLLRLATYRAKAIEGLRGSDPISRLSAEYQAYLVWVRAYQYESVQAEHERELFRRPEIERVMRDHLGFTYRDLVSVRDAMQSRYSRKLTDLRESTAEIIWANQSRGDRLTPDELETFRESMVAMMFLPAERAAFTVEDIANSGQLDPGTVALVLDQFSLDFDSGTDASARIMDFLRGRNPLAQKALARAEDEHVLVSSPPGADTFRAIAESALKSTKGWDRYDESRRVVSESLAVRALERALGSRAFATGLRYYAPSKGTPVDALNRDCAEPSAIGRQVESDALFVIGDVAICLEVKGRSVADAARRGDVNRLRTEIKNILGDGARQARRLEALIHTNGGLWRDDGTWIELGHVREIRTIVAGLDHFGPLSVGLGDLRESDLVGGETMPWVVTIHDLDVISRVLDRAAEFLLYLRRRTDSGVAAHFRGSDELDLFMLYLNGGLFVEDDPDEVHRMHPKTPAPSKTARDHFRESNRPTLVATHTDPLDAWMYWQEGTSAIEVDKPKFNVDPATSDLVDFLADDHKPGWLRTGADLLALSGPAQRRLTNAIQKVVDQTRADSKPHTLNQGFASRGGYPTFFVRTHPAGADRQEEARNLATYMLAKKHQVGSDRAIGLLVNQQGKIVTTLYMNGPPVEDIDLDALGDEMGLRRTWVKPKRATSLSEKKRKRRAKRGRR
jgi:hypothetical protein